MVAWTGATLSSNGRHQSALRVVRFSLGPRNVRQLKGKPMRVCARCGHCHIDVLLMPRTGWLLLFHQEWEENCTEQEIEYQLTNQLPVHGHTVNTVRFIELANS